MEAIQRASPFVTKLYTFMYTSISMGIGDRSPCSRSHIYTFASHITTAIEKQENTIFSTNVAEIIGHR